MNTMNLDCNLKGYRNCREINVTLYYGEKINSLVSYINYINYVVLIHAICIHVTKIKRKLVWFRHAICALSNNYGKKDDIRGLLFVLFEIKHYACTAKDDTAFTLFYIKCQVNETRRVPVLSSRVRSRQSGIFNSPCNGIRPMAGRICISLWIAVGHRKRVSWDTGTSDVLGICWYSRQITRLRGGTYRVCIPVYGNRESYQISKYHHD